MEKFIGNGVQTLNEPNLGSIFLGIASPTESAAVGALGAIIASLVYKRFSWKMLAEAASRTFTTTGMVMWILFGANCFSAVLIMTGIPSMLKVFITSLSLPPMLIVFFMMLTYFILGCFLEETTMLFITIPIYMPILSSFGMDPIWFGVLFMIAMLNEMHIGDPGLDLMRCRWRTSLRRSASVCSI